MYVCISLFPHEPRQLVVENPEFIAFKYLEAVGQAKGSSNMKH